MITILADTAGTESVLLLSVYKPLLFMLFLALWGRAVAFIDRDLVDNYLPRTMWNSINVGGGFLAMVLFLLIPFFWLGYFLMILLVVSGFAGYHFFRNTKLAEPLHWSLDGLKEWWANRQAGKGPKEPKRRSEIMITDARGTIVPEPEEETPLWSVYEALENILVFALPRRADRIEMLADANQTVVSCHIDGVRYPQTQLQPQVGLGVIDFLKLHAGLDVADRRRKQVGKITVAHRTPHQLTLTTSGTTKGLSLVLDTGGSKPQLLNFEHLGLIDAQRQQLEPVLDEPGHVVAVVCPPKNGMTTTLASLVARHDPYTTNIMALDPIDNIDIEGVNRTEVKTGSDSPSLAQQLTAMMLREPNIVLLGQLSDAETAQVVPEYAQNTRFYIGLRQADTLSAIRAWSQAIDDPQAAGSTLGAIIAMRTVRKLCLTCRVSYQPDPAVLKKLNLPPDRVQQLYKHTGKVMVKEEAQTCPDCVGIGYRGRTAIFEVMALDDDARSLVAASQFDQLRAHMRKKGMLFLQEAGLYKVVEGVTDIQEITRVLSDGKKK